MLHAQELVRTVRDAGTSDTMDGSCNSSFAERLRMMRPSLLAGHAGQRLKGIGTHLLENMTANGSRASLKSLWDRAPHPAATEDALERANSNAASQVHSACNRSSADVVPIRVVGRQLLVHTRLHEIRPLGDLDLTNTLQVGSVSDHEIVRADVLDGHTSGLRHAAAAAV